MTRSRIRVTRALIATSAIAVAASLARKTYLRWGASDDEVKMDLPGDQLLPAADLTATRAITVARPSDDVWPWLAQLGQRRGGFYSYDFLENLVGCDIHSADRIVPEWQSVDVGSAVDLAPGVGLTVAYVEAGRALVLRGAPPMVGKPAPYDFTWTFALNDEGNGTSRLIVRERYQYTNQSARLLVEPVQLISFLMSQKMLRGIRDRAQRPHPKGAALGSGPNRRRGPNERVNDDRHSHIHHAVRDLA
jgi:hypothetical protein